MTPAIGDYVIASKYDDGHFGDHWVVGWLKGMTSHDEPRYDVVDDEGESFRGNGFRRCEVVSPWVAKRVVEANKERNFERTAPTNSVWSYVNKFRNIDPDPFGMARKVDGEIISMSSRKMGDEILLAMQGCGMNRTHRLYVPHLKQMVLPRWYPARIEFDAFCKAVEKKAEAIAKAKGITV